MTKSVSQWPKSSRASTSLGLSIAQKELHCAPNTVRNIIKKGMTPLYNGKVFRFKAKTAWNAYQGNRSRSCRTYEALEKRPFIQYVEKHVREEHWSWDACVGRALKDGSFDRSEILCTKTLYNYVDLGFLSIKNIDLPQKLSRNTKTHKNKENKRILGRSMMALGFQPSFSRSSITT